MFNYFNFKKYKENFLITNDFGRYDFLTTSEFYALLLEKISEKSKTWKRLNEKYFVYDSNNEDFSCNIAFEMHNSKNYLYKSTSLHIFVVTSACNQKCVYCQAQSENNCTKGFMNKEVAKRAVNIALQSPSEYLDFEFQGGEPLLNFEIIKFIVEYSKSISNKHINYSIVTNLTLITDEMIDFIKKHNMNVSTSLDGNELVHNSNRSYQNGKGTYKDVLNSIKKLCKKGINVGAIQTTTKVSLLNYKEIVDAYVNLGFHSIFIRPLTPLGYAKEHWDEIGYTPKEFVKFYQNILDYILEKNKSGYSLVEGHARIFLTKILTGFSPDYMELRSPCGATLGQLAYYYDGNIFTCDEARMLYEMGDDSFRVGSVFKSDYNSVVDSKITTLSAKSSVLEAIPSCSECVYQPYCGVCPVINYAINNDIYETAPQEYKCKIYSGMLDSIFDYLYFNDNDSMEIFWRWIQ